MTKKQEQALRAKISKAQKETDKLKKQLSDLTGEEEVAPKKGKTLGDPICELY